MPVVNITSQDQYDAEKNKPGVMVVKYSAEWCGPCKRIAPEFEKLSNEYEGFARFYHVDVETDSLQDEDDLQDIQGVPTFKFFKNSGKKSIKIDVVGGADLSKLKKCVDKHCGVSLS